MSAAVSRPDESEASAFVHRHQHAIWRWLRALGCEAAAAEEHCQDALLAALHHGVHGWAEADANRWLRTAARNFFWMRLRALRRRPSVRSLEALEAAWQRIGGDDDGGEAALRALADCVAALPARERTLVALRYEHGRSRPEIGGELGLGEAGVKQALRRARERLRRCVQGKLGFEER